MMSNLVAVQRAFGNNSRVLLLSHSALPLIDSVPVLLKCAENHGLPTPEFAIYQYLIKKTRSTHKLAYFN